MFKFQSLQGKWDENYFLLKRKSKKERLECNNRFPESYLQHPSSKPDGIKKFTKKECWLVSFSKTVGGGLQDSIVPLIMTYYTSLEEKKE